MSAQRSSSLTGDQRDAAEPESGPLGTAEATAFAQYESVIARGLATFIEVGQALAAVRDQRLYREHHGTFEIYCQQRWSLMARYANRLIAAAEVGIVLGPQGPKTERLARELVPLAGNHELLRATWFALADHPWRDRKEFVATVVSRAKAALTAEASPEKFRLYATRLVSMVVEAEPQASQHRVSPVPEPHLRLIAIVGEE